MSQMIIFFMARLRFGRAGASGGLSTSLKVWRNGVSVKIIYLVGDCTFAKVSQMLALTPAFAGLRRDKPAHCPGRG